MISLVLIASTLMGSSAPPTEDDVVLEGTIDQSSARHVVSLLRNGPGGRTLRVTSSGGDPEAAIAIGDAIRDLQVTVTVQDYCLSSCALFVALPAPILSLKPNSVLGFHHSQTALLQLFSTTYPNARLDWERMRRVSAAETQALKRWKVSEWWLTQPMMFLDLGCIRQRDTGREFTIPRYTSSYTVWMPPQSMLANAVGEWKVGQGSVRDFESLRFTVISDMPQPKGDALGICPEA